MHVIKRKRGKDDITSGRLLRRRIRSESDLDCVGSKLSKFRSSVLWRPPGSGDAFLPVKALISMGLVMEVACQNIVIRVKFQVFYAYQCLMIHDITNGSLSLGILPLMMGNCLRYVCTYTLRRTMIPLGDPHQKQLTWVQSAPLCDARGCKLTN